MLYGQLAFSDVADDVQGDQDEDREQEFVLGPERWEWLQKLQCRFGELARDAPRTKAKKRRRGGSGVARPHRPGCRPRR